jgi:hypothetical protein
MNSKDCKNLDIMKRLHNGFPTNLAADVDSVLQLFSINPLYSASELDICIRISGDDLRIPYRLSLPETDVPLDNATEQSGYILACILSRHGNGFIRERYVHKLVHATELWVVPYLLQLVGEHVCPIIQNILDNLEHLHTPLFVDFGRENPQFIERTRQRVISLWADLYQHQFLRLAEYPGYRVMKALKLWPKRYARHLLSI